MGTPAEKRRHRRIAAGRSAAAAGMACAAVLVWLPGQAAGRSGLPGANGKIAFESNFGGSGLEIYTMDADGSDQTDLTHNPGADFGSAWSPDGSKLAFTTGRDDDNEIYVMNANGSGPVNLTNNPTANDEYPAWSPDGRKIAFVSDRDVNVEIYVMNRDGTGQLRLTNNPLSPAGAPAWSPGGERIAFATGGEVYAMDADGSAPMNLTNNPATDITPAWSPDGERIAFTSTRDLNDEIYVMNRDGSDQTRLTFTSGSGETSPVWAPDGTKIAFESDAGGDGGDKEIHVMNADGTDPTPLTANTAIDMAPAWQPVPNDLEVVASVDAITVNVGSQATYAFSVRNNGSAPAPGAKLTITPPGIMEVVSASASQGWCEMGAAIACNLGTIGGLASASASIVGRALQTGTATAQATIGAWGADAIVANNTATAGVSVVDAASGAIPGTTPDTAPGVSVRITYPRAVRTGKTKRIKRRALYRAIVKGFRGEVSGATKLEGSLVRKRGKRCRKLAKGKRTSCSKTSRRGMKVASASASSSFRYRPLRSARRAKRALRAGRRLKRGRYELLVKAYPNTGDPKLFTFKIKSA